MGWFSRRKQRKLEEQRRYELDEDGSRASRAGFQAKTEGNYHEAFQKFSEAAPKGNANAIFGLAECYCYGLGTARDLEKAREYYEKSLGGLQSWDLYSRVGLYRVFGDESYSGYDYDKAYAYLKEVVRYEERERKYYYNGHYHLAIHYARQNVSEETLLDILDYAFNKDTVCNMPPEIIKEDIDRYNLPLMVGMCDHMTTRGDTEAVHWLAKHYASKGGYKELKRFQVNKGFIKSIHGQYYLAKAYQETLATKKYLIDGDILSDGKNFWAHYTALRHNDLLYFHEIVEKYADDYKRIMKEGWAAEREDMAVYDKVFDRDYYIQAKVNDGCTNCGKCIKSYAFTQEDGLVSAENALLRLANMTRDTAKEKYEVVYYARECPAQCIQYEFHKGC